MSKLVIYGKERFLWRSGRLLMSQFLLILFMFCAGSQGKLPLVLPEKMPYNVAVVFSDDFTAGSGDHYSVSEALHAELFDCVGSVYQNVSEEFKAPADGKYDRIIEFKLVEIGRDEHNRRLANATDPSLPSRHIPLRFGVSVSVASYDGKDGELIGARVVKGVGESSSREGISIREGSGIASSADPDSFDRAVAEAVENVCRDVTKLLAHGFAEPKKKTETS